MCFDFWYSYHFQGVPLPESQLEALKCVGCNTERWGNPVWTL